MKISAYNDIVIENDRFTLTVGGDCVVKGLLYKPTGEECLKENEGISLFSATQKRPYNNEVKLAHPNKRTTYEGASLEIDKEGRLVVGFEIVPWKAVVEVVETPFYAAFKLVDYIVDYDAYCGLATSLPQVDVVRLIQLPIRERGSFGEWLNVASGGGVAVNVLATSPDAKIDSERRRDYRVMYAEAVHEVRLLGTGAAIIVAGENELLDCIDALERDFKLPLGVESRRSEYINRSAYWNSDVTPNNVDEHIKFAKAGGFSMMLLYYTSIFKERNGYALNGNYDYRPEYPNGRADLIAMLDKIKAAGINPGLHFLQTHIGLESRYVTPKCDRRLNLKRTFTLSKPLCESDSVVYVDENPAESEMHPAVRVLKFGTELISYEGFETEYPYRFTGCKRGHRGTEITLHPEGEIGGILDVTEFGGSSCYINQNSDLQDEIAAKISDAYNAGFRFVYFDGSEGTNAPFEHHVPNAQYRVYKKLSPAPFYTEGAAKAHFSWHFLSGGNAFDVFAPPVFKRKIDEFPAEEAPRMRMDYTRLNFGWWGFWLPETQADMFEYGTSRAAAWDCPVTIQVNLDSFRRHPRIADILEVMRRWEDVRVKKWLTDEQKLMLRKLGEEHILLINEKGEYELLPYFRIENAASGNPDIIAYYFIRGGKSCVIYWHRSEDKRLALGCPASSFVLRERPGGDIIAVTQSDGRAIVPVSGRRYIESELTKEELFSAFEKAELL